MLNYFDIMRDRGKEDALDLRARANDMDGTEIIAEETKVPAWTNKDYSNFPVGSPVIDEGQVWKLIQPYDATVHTGRPSESRDRWSLCHTKNPSKAKPWVDALGTSGMYMKDECYKDANGMVYRCRQDNVVYDATALPDAWETVDEA